ncbi:MAG: hypothetical protein KAT74_09415, partial [Candidatus Cloacimonetes bacterium]|nr:hypothetical protein [Candidatus Cloacimonadota bacterium]
IYEWVDITGVGTELYLSDDDYEEIALPFTFSFYGNEKNSVKISSNGYLTFGNDGTDWTNNPIPNSEDPDDFIAPMWDDLKPIGGGWGTVYYYSDIANDRFIVEYFQASHWTSTEPRDPETFEVILYPNGRILFQYHTITDESDTTIGIENAAGNDGLEVVYWNGSYLENNLAILIKTVVDWVELSSQSGIIESGFEDHITITVSSNDLELGDYLCNLMLSTNDPEASLMTIPVNLSVVSQILYPPENVIIYIIESHGLWVYIGWDVVTGADSYNVYASNEPHLPFESWELVASGITDNHWLTPVSGSYKFYKVVSVLN